jgi:hypothetical protein
MIVANAARTWPCQCSLLLAQLIEFVYMRVTVLRSAVWLLHSLILLVVQYSSLGLPAAMLAACCMCAGTALMG